MAAFKTAAGVKKANSRALSCEWGEGVPGLCCDPFAGLRASRGLSYVVRKIGQRA